MRSCLRQGHPERGVQAKAAVAKNNEKWSLTENLSQRHGDDNIGGEHPYAGHDPQYGNHFTTGKKRRRWNDTNAPYASSNLTLASLPSLQTPSVRQPWSTARLSPHP